MAAVRRWAGVVRLQLAKAFPAAATAASIWLSEASGTGSINAPVRGFSTCSAVSVPASKREPISIWVSMSLSRSYLPAPETARSPPRVR